MNFRIITFFSYFLICLVCIKIMSENREKSMLHIYFHSEFHSNLKCRFFFYHASLCLCFILLAESIVHFFKNAKFYGWSCLQVKYGIDTHIQWNSKFINYHVINFKLCVPNIFKIEVKSIIRYSEITSHLNNFHQCRIV